MRRWGASLDQAQSPENAMKIGELAARAETSMQAICYDDGARRLAFEVDPGPR